MYTGGLGGAMRKSFKDSIKVLEADIQHANTLASDFSGEYDGACLQMRMSYSPAAHIFLFLVQWTDCHLAGALGLLRILIYKVHVDGTTTMSTHERKASIREFYAVIYPSLVQLERGVTDSDDKKQNAVCQERYKRRDSEDYRKAYDLDIEREDECGICMEVNSKIILPNCNHIMCLKCYRECLLQAIDYILEGTQNLVIPIQDYIGGKPRKTQSKSSSLRCKHRNGVEYCWLTQEDVVRFLLNFIGVFSPITTSSIESLNVIDCNVMTICYHEPAMSALDSLTLAHVEQTSVAVVDDLNRLIGEISPSTLAYCDETAAAAVMTLSASDLLAYIDCGGPPDDLVDLVKVILQEKNLSALLELMDEELSLSTSSSSCSASLSCSSDDELGVCRNNGSGRYSSARRAEAITCYPNSSLVAVMIQALAHRASSVWVMHEDNTLIGHVTFKGILKVFRSLANARMITR